MHASSTPDEANNSSGGGGGAASGPQTDVDTSKKAQLRRYLIQEHTMLGIWKAPNTKELTRRDRAVYFFVFFLGLHLFIGSVVVWNELRSNEQCTRLNDCLDACMDVADEDTVDSAFGDDVEQCETVVGTISDYSDLFLFQQPAEDASQGGWQECVANAFASPSELGESRFTCTWQCVGDGDTPFDPDTRLPCPTSISREALVCVDPDAACSQSLEERLISNAFLTSLFVTLPLFVGKRILVRRRQNPCLWNGILIAGGSFIWLWFLSWMATTEYGQWEMLRVALLSVFITLVLLEPLRMFLMFHLCGRRSSFDQELEDSRKKAGTDDPENQPDGGGMHNGSAAASAAPHPHTGQAHHQQQQPVTNNPHLLGANQRSPQPMTPHQQQQQRAGGPPHGSGGSEW